MVPAATTNVMTERRDDRASPIVLASSLSGESSSSSPSSPPAFGPSDCVVSTHATEKDGKTDKDVPSDPREGQCGGGEVDGSGGSHIPKGSNSNSSRSSRRNGGRHIPKGSGSSASSSSRTSGGRTTAGTHRIRRGNDDHDDDDDDASVVSETRSSVAGRRGVMPEGLEERIRRRRTVGMVPGDHIPKGSTNSSTSTSSRTRGGSSRNGGTIRPSPTRQGTDGHLSVHLEPDRLPVPGDRDGTVGPPLQRDDDDDDDDETATTSALISGVREALSVLKLRSEDDDDDDATGGGGNGGEPDGQRSAKLEELRSSRRSRESQLKELVMEQQQLLQQKAMEREVRGYGDPDAVDAGGGGGSADDATDVLTVIVNLKDELMAAHEVIRQQRLQLEHLLTTKECSQQNSAEVDEGAERGNPHLPVGAEGMVPLSKYQRLKALHCQLEIDRAWGEFRLRERITSDALKFHRRLKHWRGESEAMHSTLEDNRREHAEQVQSLFAQVEDFHQRAVLAEEDLKEYKAIMSSTMQELCRAQDRIASLERQLPSVKSDDDAITKAWTERSSSGASSASLRFHPAVPSSPMDQTQ